METNMSVTKDEELHDAADALMEAAMRYWRVYQRAAGGAAVVWVKDSDGRMVILTRGEYQQTLMRNIDSLHDGSAVLTFEPANVKLRDSPLLGCPSRMWGWALMGNS